MIIQVLYIKKIIQIKSSFNNLHIFETINKVRYLSCFHCVFASSNTSAKIFSNVKLIKSQDNNAKSMVLNPIKKIPSKCDLYELPIHSFKKYAIFMSFCGKGYYGMQLQNRNLS